MLFPYAKTCMLIPMMTAEEFNKHRTPIPNPAPDPRTTLVRLSTGNYYVTDEVLAYYGTELLDRINDFSIRGQSVQFAQGGELPAQKIADRISDYEQI